MAVALWGIASCDKVRAARRWMAQQGIEHDFHDPRRDGLPAALGELLAEHGPARLLNRRSVSWRALSAAQREAALGSPAGALAALAEAPTLLHRPLLLTPAGLQLGFDPARWRACLDGAA